MRRVRADCSVVNEQTLLPWQGKTTDNNRLLTSCLRRTRVDSVEAHVDVLVGGLKPDEETIACRASEVYADGGDRGKTETA